jgi:hypothetical protein
MRGLSKKIRELIAFARQVLEEHHPMTLRQLHYAIFSAAKIDYKNEPEDYKRLSRATTRARRDYREYELFGMGETDPDLLDSVSLIPPDWIVDELREAEQVSMWTDVGEYMTAVKRSYRRDNWQTQPNYCEVWSEKATVLGSLRPITEEYGVMLRACRGFGSTGMETQVGNLFEGIDKPITIYYAGDHDPSGHDIERDIHRRAQAASGKELAMIRLAIHPADIKAFRLPPQKIKKSDSRAAGFERKFGKKAPTVELDALPVEELRRRVREAIEVLIDFELWNRQVAVQAVELKCIAEFADTVKNLPQVKNLEVTD